MKKIYSISILFVVLAGFCLTAGAQGISVNATGSPPDNSAGMDINFTNKGFLMPRLTTAQRDSIANPAMGLFIFNTDCKVVNFNAGTPESPQWAVMSSSNALTASVSIAANPTGAICSETSVTFTATPAAGINSPSYQWQVNGNNAGSNSATYTSSSLNNGDVVTCILSSASPCVAGSPATSNAIAMTVNPAPGTPGAISGSSSVCAASTGNVYSISPVAGATSYSWTVPNGSTITSGTGNTSVTITFGSDTGTISVAAVNGCGTGSANSLPVTISGVVPSTPDSISGATSFWPGLAGITYQISPVANATSYSWTFPAGVTVASGNNTDSITVNWGSNFSNICVTASDLCGTSPSTCLAVNSCTVGWQYNVNWTQNNSTYESSQLSGASYNATNTMLNNGSFWLSNNGEITDQWIIYDLQSEHTVDEIQIANGQDPYGSKDMILQTGPSLAGPWTNVLSFTAADVEATLQPFTISPIATSRYWRLYFLDNYGSSNYIKLEGLQFHSCP